MLNKQQTGHFSVYCGQILYVGNGQPDFKKYKTDELLRGGGRDTPYLKMLCKGICR